MDLTGHYRHFHGKETITHLQTDGTSSTILKCLRQDVDAATAGQLGLTGNASLWQIPQDEMDTANLDTLKLGETIIGANGQGYQIDRLGYDDLTAMWEAFCSQQRTNEYPEP